MLFIWCIDGEKHDVKRNRNDDKGITGWKRSNLSGM